MGTDLRIACIDCTKYEDTDSFGPPLAFLCHASYLSVVFLASVFYAKRDLVDGAILGGAVINAGLGKALKLTWRQPRPSAKCALLGKCDSYGMPSSHTQVVAYLVAISLVVKLTSRHPTSKLLRVISTGETVGLTILCVLVGYARVHLGYHTAFQTLIGGSLGLAFGLLWARLVAIPVQQNSQRILRRWPILRSLACTSLLQRAFHEE